MVVLKIAISHLHISDFIFPLRISHSNILHDLSVIHTFCLSFGSPTGMYTPQLSDLIGAAHLYSPSSEGCLTYSGCSINIFE